MREGEKNNIISLGWHIEFFTRPRDKTQSGKTGLANAAERHWKEICINLIFGVDFQQISVLRFPEK